WADFDDPLDAIGARAAEIRARAAGRQQARHQASRFTPQERQALETMGLGLDTDLHGLRKRYSTLVRRYHPDRNGGDRSHEGRLQLVIESYQLLRKAAAFGWSGRGSGGMIPRRATGLRSWPSLSFSLRHLGDPHRR